MHTILIRISVGFIFLSEGIQKFLFTDELGEGRFLKIGIPFPFVIAPTVGATEIFCGLLVLIGYRVRYAALPIIFIMIIALSVTKIANIPEQGFWEVAHGARTDFAMLMSGLFLWFSGSGKYSLEVWLKENKEHEFTFNS